MPLRRAIKNTIANYTPAELRVREATSNDPILPDFSILMDIVRCIDNPTYRYETSNMIWRRLNDKGKNWRHIYKALLVIDFCLKHASLSVSSTITLFGNR